MQHLSHFIYVFWIPCIAVLVRAVPGLGCNGCSRSRPGQGGRAGFRNLGIGHQGASGKCRGLWIRCSWARGGGKARKLKRGWRNDQTSAWLIKTRLQPGGLEDQPEAESREGAWCTSQQGWEGTASSTWSQVWEERGAMEVSEAMHEEAALFLLMSCTGWWLFSPACAAKRCVWSAVMPLAFGIKPCPCDWTLDLASWTLNLDFGSVICVQTVDLAWDSEPGGWL